MKKLITLSIITTMALSSTVFANTSTAVKTSAIIHTNASGELVPAREYAEEIGYDVEWNGADKSITFTKGENIFIATVGSGQYYCDIYGSDPETITLNQSTIIVDNTAYIPKEFSKRLFDIPVVEPMPIIPITPEVPVIDTIVTIESIENDFSEKLNADISNKIANIIYNKMNELEEEQIEANKEYKDAYLSTGGSIDDYIEPTYQIDYEIISCDDDYTSVKVYRFQALASSFTEEIFYTFDSKTGEQLSLEYFLGEGYEEAVKTIVVVTAKERMVSDPEKYNYFKESLDELVIDENTSFYIDEDDNVVVSFEKYELAAGVYGSQQFIVGKIK